MQRRNALKLMIASMTAPAYIANGLMRVKAIVEPKIKLGYVGEYDTTNMLTAYGNASSLRGKTDVILLRPDTITIDDLEGAWVREEMRHRDDFLDSLLFGWSERSIKCLE